MVFAKILIADSDLIDRVFIVARLSEVLADLRHIREALVVEVKRIQIQALPTQIHIIYRTYTAVRCLLLHSALVPTVETMIGSLRKHKCEQLIVSLTPHAILMLPAILGRHHECVIDAGGHDAFTVL